MCLCDPCKEHVASWRITHGTIKAQMRKPDEVVEQNAHQEKKSGRISIQSSCIDREEGKITKNNLYQARLERWFLTLSHIKK